MKEAVWEEVTWRTWTPVAYYGRRFGIIVTFNARLFWAWDRHGPRHLHVCAGPLEVSLWDRGARQVGSA